jgi:hypothetical protein
MRFKVVPAGATKRGRTDSLSARQRRSRGTDGLRRRVYF